ncbi:unnamed protein product [Prorocentrum cordatum]|uniref:Copper transporter n=1 Tax=Prorocentrum cordatum TaxID=2364126 RepID=A0ABN9UT29_9DINO|nr:unnamed protein product [Polarella glacialis]
MTSFRTLSLSMVCGWSVDGPRLWVAVGAAYVQVGAFLHFLVSEWRLFVALRAKHFERAATGRALRGRGAAQAARSLLVESVPRDACADNGAGVRDFFERLLPSHSVHSCSEDASTGWLRLHPAALLGEGLGTLGRLRAAPPEEAAKAEGKEAEEAVVLSVEAAQPPSEAAKPRETKVRRRSPRRRSEEGAKPKVEEAAQPLGEAEQPKEAGSRADGRAPKRWGAGPSGAGPESGGRESGAQDGGTGDSSGAKIGAAASCVAYGAASWDDFLRDFAWAAACVAGTT